MELRPAEVEDLPACALISSVVASGYVWQISLAHDPTSSVLPNNLGATLHCLRLPRAVAVQPPGEPWEQIWERAAAVFVAVDDEVVRGCAALTPAEERPALHLARLVVAPGARRRRTGSRLLRMAQEWTASAGYTHLTAHCSARNHPAVVFFARSGFSFAGYSEAYYPRDEIALFWQRPV